MKKTYKITAQNLRKVFLLFSLLLAYSYATAQSLESYIDEAYQNSPQIEALDLQYEVASEKVNATNSLPNTEFSAGYFVSEPETRTGPQRARLSVRQMMPWFGTITARENYASSMADATYTEIAIAKRRLALSITQSFYRLYSMKAKQRILTEQLELLSTYEDLALTAVEVNKASMVDVLRLQIRQNELTQQKALIEGDEMAEESNFNNLLNRDESMELLIPDSLAIPFEEPVLAIDELELHPELVKFDKMYESVEQSELMNQKEASPNLGFGLDYVAVSERQDMDISDNGKDILMPMISVSIPIFNNKYKSVTRQNELRQKEIQAQKNERKNKLDTQLKEAIQQRISARITYDTQSQNIQQAEDAEEILLRKYESGTLDFTDVLDIQELQLRFQLQQIEAIKNYYLQTAIINYLSN